MHLFKPIKLKKQPIVWYVYKWGGMMVNTDQLTKLIGGKLVCGEKREAITQPLWWWPYSLQIIKHSKQKFAMGVTGIIIMDLYCLRIWKKDDIMLTLQFYKHGNIIEGWKKYKINKKRKNYPYH